MIELKKIYKKYGKIEIVKGFSLCLENGEKIAIMGQSGSGKTTILNIIAGLVKADSGEIICRDKKAYMFQEDRLLPTFNLEENVLATLRSKNKREIAKRYIRLVELDAHKEKYPAELSGGMRQRVAFARFLAYAEENNATLLLLDEPFSALDEGMRDRMLQILMGFSKDKSVIYVTHNVLEAEKLSNRIIKI